MEFSGAVVACLGSVGLGLYFARLWAPSAGRALLIGIAVGGICAVEYLASTLLVGRLAPHVVDAERIGFWFVMLLAAAPACGALGSFVGYRRAPGLP